MTGKSYHQPIRCAVCGRFIAYDDLISDKAETEYIPETEFTREKIQYFHEACVVTQGNTTNSTALCERMRLYFEKISLLATPPSHMAAALDEIYDTAQKALAELNSG